MPIIIIESPNKKEKIKKFSGFDCEATAGHFLFLDGVDIENNYQAKWEYYEKKKSSIFNLINKCKNNEVYIATDPDREGYAIGYLLYERIKNVAKTIYRAEFNEITESGVKKGLQNAVAFSNTNMHYFKSFLARVIIDRLIGFIVSPFLYQELKAKSAGRVQTPALRLIVDRHKEIQAFENLPLEEKLFYCLEAKTLLNGKEVVIKHIIDGKEAKFNTKAQAEEIYNSIKDTKTAVITNIDVKDTTSSPTKPFTTSKLLKTASRKLKLSSDKIQSLAQELFENGLITYIRTDSEFISKEFLAEMKDFYSPIYKDSYEYREYKAGANSQAEAHEAIRITHCHKIEEIEEVVKKENIKAENLQNAINLYKLIFINTLQSQLKNATYKSTKIIFNVRLEEFVLNVKQLVDKGYLELESNDNEEEDLADNALLNNIKVDSTTPINEVNIKEGQKQPPKPYLESDFIEVLEKSGIGRPSTYATYIPKLLERTYIDIDKKRYIQPTLLGISVIDFLANHKYKFVLDLGFTKEMEDKLDLIKDNKFNHISLIKDIHHRLDFTPLNNNNKTDSSNIAPPNDKQKKFANDIANALNIKLPDNYENDWRIVRKFIDENIEKYNKSNKSLSPTDKMINYAKSIAKTLNIELPKNYESDGEIISKFINENKSKMPKRG